MCLLVETSSDGSVWCGALILINFPEERDKLTSLEISQFGEPKLSYGSYLWFAARRKLSRDSTALIILLRQIPSGGVNYKNTLNEP